MSSAKMMFARYDLEKPSIEEKVRRMKPLNLSMISLFFPLTTELSQSNCLFPIS